MLADTVGPGDVITYGALAAKLNNPGMKDFFSINQLKQLNQFLFADDTVVVADSERKLCQLVTEFGRVCERRKL